MSNLQSQAHLQPRNLRSWRLPEMNQHLGLLQDSVYSKVSTMYDLAIRGYCIICTKGFCLLTRRLESISAMVSTAGWTSIMAATHSRPLQSHSRNLETGRAGFIICANSVWISLLHLDGTKLEEPMHCGLCTDTWDLSALAWTKYSGTKYVLFVLFVSVNK